MAGNMGALSLHAGLGPTAEDAAHLLRFMCQTWVQVDAWAREHCTDMDAIGTYPVIQGTGNQIKLMRIGAQPFDPKRLQAGMQWMLGPNVAMSCPCRP